MKVLIAGGAGFIGSTTAKLFAKSGHDVTLLDDMSTGHQHNIEGLNLIKGSCGDKQLLARTFKEHSFDAVLHFAAKIRVDESMSEPFLYFDNNTSQALALIDESVKAKIKNFVFSSTAAVYGEPDTEIVAESHPARPINPYGLSKYLTEQILASYGHTHALNWTAFRYFNAAGAYNRIGPDYPFMSHLIPSIIRSLQSGKKFRLYGDDYNTPDGTCVRDFVHVEDIARAHVMAVEKMAGGLTVQRPVNLGSSNGFSILQVIKLVEEVSGKKVTYEIEPRRPGDYGQIRANNDLAQELFTWKPQHDLKQIIQDAYSWQLKYKTI